MKEVQIINKSKTNDKSQNLDYINILKFLEYLRKLKKILMLQKLQKRQIESSSFFRSVEIKTLLCKIKAKNIYKKSWISDLPRNAIVIPHLSRFKVQMSFIKLKKTTLHNFTSLTKHFSVYHKVQWHKQHIEMSL